MCVWKIPFRFRRWMCEFVRWILCLNCFSEVTVTKRKMEKNVRKKCIYIVCPYEIHMLPSNYILGRWLLFPMFCIPCEKFLVILLSSLIEFYLLLVFIIVVVVVLLPVYVHVTEGTDHRQQNLVKHENEWVIPSCFWRANGWKKEKKEYEVVYFVRVWYFKR